MKLKASRKLIKWANEIIRLFRLLFSLIILMRDFFD